MRYTITVVHGRKPYRYTVEHTAIDQRTEHFKLLPGIKPSPLNPAGPFFVISPPNKSY